MIQLLNLGENLAICFDFKPIGKAKNSGKVAEVT
jgi:hypothetical protein